MRVREKKIERDSMWIVDVCEYTALEVCKQRADNEFAASERVGAH